MIRTKKHPRFSHYYTREFDELLVKLVGIYGENKWADITRQLNQIHGYDIKDPHAAPCRWNKLNPRIDRTQFTPEQAVEFWHLCLKHKLNYSEIKAYYDQQQLGQTRDKGLISHRFYSMFRKNMAEINRLIGRHRHANRKQIYLFLCTTKKKMLEHYDKDQTNIQDPISRDVLQSCNKLIKALTFMIEKQGLERNEKYAELLTILSKEDFQNILQHMSLIDWMIRIQYNNVDVQEKEKVKKEVREKNAWVAPIRTWGDAREEPVDSDQDSEVRGYREREKIILSKEEIKHVKESFLYMMLFDDIWARYYQWYNEAKIPKITDRQFVVAVDEKTEDLDEPQVQKKRKVKKTVAVPNLKIKKVEDDTKIKTVRGSIRYKKELFPGCLTKIFKYNDFVDNDNDAEFIDADPELMYNLAIGQNEKQEEKVE